MSNSRKPSTVQRLQNVTLSKHSPTPESLETTHFATSVHATDNNSNELLRETSSVNSESPEPITQPSNLNTTKTNNEITKSSTLLSRITTIKFNESMIVPIKSRRGLLARFCLIPEYTDARELPPKLRNAIVFIIAFCAMLGPMGTSILLPASDDAVKDLKTSITILNVAIGVYLITLGVIPLWWSNLSERHGRRSVYIISFILYLGFTIGCALSGDINTLIGFRVLSGGCAASVQSVGAGTIGDLYPITKRGAAMGLFYLGPLAGPLLSPIIGGAITSNPKFGWRATQWFLVCLSGGCCLLIIFFLPETLRKQDNKEAIRQILRERRKNRIPKNDEEATSNKEKTTQESSNSTVDDQKSMHSINTHTSDVHESHAPIQFHLSPSVSIDSQAMVDNDEDDVDDEEVERLNKLLTRMSTRPSFVGTATKSRRSSVVTNPSNSPSIDDHKEFAADVNNDETDDDYEDDNDEMPVMDAVVPLSKVATNNTNNFIEKKKRKRSSIAAELDNIEKIRKGKKVHIFLHYCKIYLYGPLKAFVFMRYPPVFLAMMYSAPCFAALYVQNMTLTYMYSKDPYNFSSVLVGLVYIPNSVTYFIASIWGGKFNDYLLKKKIEKYGIVAPEARFGINVYVAAAILPLSMLITGWCLEYGEQWVTPLIGTALFGFAQMIVIGVTVTYLADCLPGKGATGIALNNFIRMIMAAGVSFATEPLIKAIGTGVLFSICSGVTAALSILLVIIIKRGDYWRETYDLEKLYDIVDG
ncbi:hypothetical protein C6P40_001774 [Pichia californica]|uniref:Major facilitator superfamily (MFS) profile domain-containing protein n=1 Tax=Pichia californica TaxID=460514 RepID=A0A9P6WJA9_9ASCO|nr:hypothetical protein C6P42_005063 [[Candida] californica]KAG0687854.1 hypothetical protein C6P40_001774 [[Candida] californica]